MPRGTIRRLRNGVVPTADIEHLSVGYLDIRETLLERIVRLAELRQSPPLLVRGEWGSGKSHCISYIRAACQKLNTASSVVAVNARTHALNHPQRFYPLLANNLELGTGPRGFRNVLLSQLRNGVDRDKLAHFAQSRLRSELGTLLSALLRDHSGPNGLPALDHPAWFVLLGADLAWANYAYKRQKAIDRIVDLGRVMRFCGASGLVLLLDEVETVDQLHNIRSRRGAYSVLGSLGKADCLWCVFSITARFDAILTQDIARGLLVDGELSESGAWFAGSWRQRRLEIIEPPQVDRSSAFKLAKKVVGLYEKAYGQRPNDRIKVRERAEQWCDDPGRNPRILLRGIVDALDQGRPLRPQGRRSQMA